MARPKKTYQQLLDSGARAGRLAERKAEEEGIAKATESKPPKLALNIFIAQVKKERESFFERIVPGQVVCKDYDKVFDWPAEHPLTIIKNYAEQIGNGTIVSGDLTKRACARFLADLRTGADRELFIDPIAVENIATWFEKFGEPGFTIQSWELFIVGQLMGWKHPSGLRRFREAWWEVAKKNGKTALMGGMALFLTIADQEPNAEVYSLANTRDQARICFKAAQHWHGGNSELRENVKQFQSSFVYESSTYQILSSESKTADGPNVHAAFFDEVHEFLNGELFEKITAGRAARQQPLVISSTTAGNRPESFGGMRHEYFERLLMGMFEDDSKFAVIYTLDEDDKWNDESVWGKANPNLAAIPSILVFMKEKVKDVENDPSRLFDVLRYHCNRWSTAQEGHSLPPDRVAACKGLKSDMSRSAEVNKKFRLRPKIILVVHAV